MSTTWKGRPRFYGEVKVVHHVVDNKHHPEAYEIELDGRRLRTPGHSVFKLPSKGLAALVAQEWDAQVCVLETTLMPVTMSCATAIDLTSTRRSTIIAELLRYLNTDIVCFPQKLLEEIDELSGDSKKLRHEQQARWDHAIKHFTQNYGNLEILDSDTLRSPNHHSHAYERAKARLEELNDFQLTAVHELAKGCKSLVVPLALLDRKITVKEAFKAVRVEEDHQIGNWGLVEGAHDVEHESLMAQIAAASLILWLV